MKGAERARLDDARAAAAGRGRGGEDLLGGRLRAVVALRAFGVAAEPPGVSQREMMPTAAALPHIVVNALDSLFRLLSLLEQRVVVRLVEERHQRPARRAAAPVAPAPLPEADDRTHDAEGKSPQQADHNRDAGPG